MNERMVDDPIVLEGVTKAFGKKSVLSGLSGRIAAGKMVGLLGRNGEGKTTLLRLMLDILIPDSGKISILGLSPDRTGQIRKLIGYIPERPSFHNFWSAEQVFSFRSRLFKTWDAGKAIELSRNLDLDPRTAIRTASKGTLAKIAWVCALAHRPKLLLLDEPTSGLDLVVRQSILRNLIGEMSEEGTTILVANHRMEELAGILDGLWILSAGKIQRTIDMEIGRASCRERV